MFIALSLHKSLFEPRYEICNNVVCATSKASDQLIRAEYSMAVKLLTEHHLEFLSLKGGCAGSVMSFLHLKDVTYLCKRMRHSPTIGGISSVQGRKVGRS